jgi:anti-sigma factor RsiW
MSCSSHESNPESKPDWKAYALGELNPETRAQAEAHAATCSACSEELAALRLTLDMMSTLREEEIPRRIAFVSDKVFEPRWWQRIFNPTFASACVIAVAILVHGFVRPVNSDAQVQAQVNAAVAKAVAQLDEQRAEAEASYKHMYDQYAQMFITTTGLER